VLALHVAANIRDSITNYEKTLLDLDEKMSFYL